LNLCQPSPFDCIHAKLYFPLHDSSHQSEELAVYASIYYLPAMNSKHRKTLAAVFTDPVSGTIEWAAVESLLLAAGARLIEGRGSRVRFEKDGEVATFHRPHPAKEAKRYQVRDARDFLERIGVRP
jgi:hypothetical protein